MHATGMNMAKKQHKVAEGRFQSELTRQLQLEVLNMTQRREMQENERLARKLQELKFVKKRTQEHWNKHKNKQGQYSLKNCLGVKHKVVINWCKDSNR